MFQNRRFLLWAATLAPIVTSTMATAAEPHRCSKLDATVSSQHRVTYKLVQQTPEYDVSRPEVVSGTRVTLFANFLGQEAGMVMFNLNGTSVVCDIVEWQGDSVTVNLPLLGLLGPKDAEIQIVLPEGRIAKTFRVRYIAQPDIVVHEDTIPQPSPPAPVSQRATYATPVGGGLILQAGM